MTPHSTLRRPGEEGSLLLALLAVLIVGALVTVLLASTVTGQRQVQFDRNFSNAIHPADSGIEAAITYINTKEASDTSRPNTEDVLTDAGVVSDGHSFTWEAKKVTDRKWEIFAYGEAPDGTVRLLEAEVVPQPLFQFAAFAKTKVGLGGGNTADSYDPDPNDNGRGANDGVVDTGFGIVGSNGVISIDNNSTANNVDGAELHNFQEGDTLEDRIQGNCGNCDEFRILVEDGGKLYGVFENPLVFDTWWITRTLTAMEDRNPSSPYNDSAKHSDSAPEKCNAYLADNPQGDFDPAALPDQLQFDDGEIRAVQEGVTYTWTTTPDGDIPPGVWCAGGSGVTLEGATNSRIDLHRGAPYNDPSDPDPATIYTSGDVRIGSQMNINCSESGYTCADGHPFSTNVQIYTTGSEFFIGNQANVAAVLYAPNAQCTSPTSNASADIYGAVVCDNMTNVGGWAFHFDENSRSITKQEYHIDTWREEPGGTTFDWVTISPR